MIFGFGKKDVDDDVEEEIELISFLGARNGKTPELQQNPGLVRAGLIPAKEMVSDAAARRAQMLRLEPKGDRFVGLMVVDGQKYPGLKYSKQQGNAITQILKLLAGLSIQERQKPQRGGIKAEFDGLPYEVTIDITPVPGGERLNVYIENLKTRAEKPEDIGISDELKEKIRVLAAEKQGLILTCGGPRSGLSTSTIGVVRSVDAYVFNVFIIFDPGSWDIPYVTYFEKLEENEDLETTLIRCQRVEGEVIYCPPFNTEKEAKLLFEHSSKSTLIAEFPARDTASGLEQLIKWVGDPEIVATQLKGLITSKLIRRLCPSCKQAYAPNPKLLAKIGLSKDTKALYRHRVQPQELAKGEVWETCPKCNDMGYIGQVAMFELLEMTEGLQEVVRQGATPESIRRQMKSDDMLTLQKDGLRLVAEGLTSLEELQRTFKS